MEPIAIFITTIVLDLGWHKTLNGTTSDDSHVAVVTIDVSNIWFGFGFYLNYFYILKTFCIIAIIQCIAAVMTIIAIVWDWEVVLDFFFWWNINVRAKNKYK